VKILIILALVMSCSVANAQLLSEWYFRGTTGPLPWTDGAWTNASTMKLNMLTSANPQLDSSVVGTNTATVYGGAVWANWSGAMHPYVATWSTSYLQDHIAEIDEAQSVMMAAWYRMDTERPVAGVLASDDYTNAIVIRQQSGFGSDYEFFVEVANGGRKSLIFGDKMTFLDRWTHVMAAWDVSGKMVAIQNGHIVPGTNLSGPTATLTLNPGRPMLQNWHNYPGATDSSRGRSQSGQCDIYATDKTGLTFGISNGIALFRDQAPDWGWPRYEMGTEAYTSSWPHTVLCVPMSYGAYDFSQSYNNMANGAGDSSAAGSANGIGRTSLVYRVFDGTDDYWTLNAAEADVRADDEGGFGAWFNVTGDTNGTTHTIMSLSDKDTNTYVAVDVVEGSLQAKAVSEGTVQWVISNEVSLTTGIWYHAWLEHDGSNPVLYTNGAVAHAATTNGADKTAYLADLTTDIGNLGVLIQQYTTNGFFAGGLDEPRVATNTSFDPSAYFDFDKLTRGYAP